MFGWLLISNLFSYETGNSIIAEETGFLKNVGVKDEEALVQYGSYSYTDPDGNIITVRYTADEGGFRAEGDHLPTPPPVPPEVQKGLDIIFESIRQQAVRFIFDIFFLIFSSVSRIIFFIFPPVL